MEEHKIKLTVDTGNSTKDVEKLNKALEDTQEELVPLTSIMGEMEDKLMLMAHAGDTTSKEFQKLATEVAGMRKTIRETDAGIEAMSMTTGQKLGGALGGLTSGFEAAQGAMGAFGVDAAQVEQALLKVQSAMAIQQGFAGIRESIPSFKALGTSATEAFGKMTTAGKAFAITGIGLLLTGVGLLIAKWDDVSEALGGASKEQKLYGDVAKKAVESINGELNAANKLSGILKDETISRKDKVKYIKEFQAQYPGLLDNINTEKMSMKQINDQLQQNIGLLKLQAEAKALSSLREETYGKKAQLQMELHTGALENATNATFRFGDAAKNGWIGYTSAAENAAEARKNINQLENEGTKLLDKQISMLDKSERALQKEIEALKSKGAKTGEVSAAEEKANEEAEKAKEKELERQQKLKEAREKAAEARKQSLDEIKQAEKEYQDSLLTDQQLEIKNATEKYDALLAKAQKYKQDTTELEDAKANELNNINVKYAQEAQAIEDERILKEQEAQKEADAKALELLQQQNDVKKEIRYAQIEEEFGIEEEKRQRERDAIVADFDEKMKLFSEGSDEYKQLKELKESELAAVDQTYKDAEKARNKQLRDDIIEATRRGFELVGNLAGMFAGKSKAQQKKAFAVQKAANIAVATIDTYKAAQSAFASAGNPIVGAVFAGIAVAAGVANIMKIAKTKFDDSGGAGGGGGAISAGSGGGGGSAPASTPEFNIVGNSPVAALAQMSTQPQQAFVVSGEVTSAQSLDRNRVSNATL